MSLVVDYSMGYDINTLRANNVVAACRYIGFTSWSLPQDKIITYKEAYDLSKAGISIVSNWEWGGDPSQEDGKWSAQMAEALHKSIGGPPNAPIYFSYDKAGDGSDAAQYFKDVASVIGLDRVGVYGPYAAVKWLYENGLVKWLWQTYAWSGGQWYPGVHLQQYNNGVQMGNMTVDYDAPQVSNFGQWTLPANAPAPVWYQYPICVPFGNANYDSGLGGSHDLDVAPPANMPVTAIVSGTISDISAPDWGKQVGIKLDSPINGIGYFHHLHLSATNPSLQIGQHVKFGDLIGWVGGGNSQADYAGTSNPTGQNFTNSTNSSSRIQTGIALMNGPAYGGPGWVNFPPIDTNLDPTPVLQAARNSFTGGSMGLPAGWTDVVVNGDKQLHNPYNSFIVRGGFRSYVLEQPNWPQWNVPKENEHNDAIIEESNPALGGGPNQCFADTRLEMLQAHNGQVIEGWLGQELVVVKADRAAKEAALADAQKTIANLTAQLAACQQASGGITPEMQTAINEAVAAQPSIDSVLAALKPFAK